jgi:hypothetical protein
VDTPEVGVQYVFVRVEAGSVLYGEFTRYDDSSGFVIPSSREHPELMTLERDNDPDGWPKVLAHLLELGYIELSEAKRLGIVPDEWGVPAGEGDFGVDAAQG